MNYVLPNYQPLDILIVYLLVGFAIMLISLAGTSGEWKKTSFLTKLSTLLCIPGYPILILVALFWKKDLKTVNMNDKFKIKHGKSSHRTKRK